MQHKYGRVQIYVAPRYATKIWPGSNHRDLSYIFYDEVSLIIFLERII